MPICMSDPRHRSVWLLAGNEVVGIWCMLECCGDESFGFGVDARSLGAEGVREGQDVVAM